jgi:hypothetical protein
VEDSPQQRFECPSDAVQTIPHQAPKKTPEKTPEETPKKTAMKPGSGPRLHSPRDLAITADE